MTGGEQPGTIHIHPAGDLIDHETADDCLCGPRRDPVVSSDGSVGWVVLHYSLDGRGGHEYAAKLREDHR